MVGVRVAFPMALPAVFELRLAALFHGGLSTSGTSGQSFLTTAMKLANLQHIVCLIGKYPTFNKQLTAPRIASSAFHPIMALKVGIYPPPGRGTGRRLP